MDSDKNMRTELAADWALVTTSVGLDVLELCENNSPLQDELAKRGARGLRLSP